MSCNLSEYVWEKGYQKGLRLAELAGLAALVRTLKQFYHDFAGVHEAVVRNPEYADVTEDEVREVYDKSS